MTVFITQEPPYILYSDSLATIELSSFASLIHVNPALYQQEPIPHFADIARSKQAWAVKNGAVLISQEEHEKDFHGLQQLLFKYLAKQFAIEALVANNRDLPDLLKSETFNTALFNVYAKLGYWIRLIFPLWAVNSITGELRGGCVYRMTLGEVCIAELMKS